MTDRVSMVDPKDVKPGEVWSVDPPEDCDGEWIGLRNIPEAPDSPWYCIRMDTTAVTWVSDSEVVLRHRMVEARPVTRDDLPDADEVHRAYRSAPWNSSAFVAVLDAVIGRLNTHGGLGVDARESLEQALRERDEARGDRDAARETAEHYKDMLDAEERQRNYWQTRAAWAETQLSANTGQLPTVTYGDVEKAVRDGFDYGGTVGEVQGIADTVFSLVSDVDPAVFVVRESDLPEVRRRSPDTRYGGPGGWETPDEDYLYSKGVTVADLQEEIEANRWGIAVALAVQRAIEAEAAVDPVEELAEQIESATRKAIHEACSALAFVAPGLDPLAVERAMEVTAASRKVAAHVLEQEAGDE